MGRIRGFLLKHRVTTIFRCFYRRNRSPMGYHRLESDPRWGVKPISSLFSWTHKIKNRAKAICWRSSSTKKKNLVPARRVVAGHGYMQIGEDPIQEEKKKQNLGGIPKGYMAVYVGQKDGDFQRVLVPVMYFNHPLFGELLRGAEEEFGFNHPGAITLPCRISEFEHVQTRIKQGWGARKLLKWKH